MDRGFAALFAYHKQKKGPKTAVFVFFANPVRKNLSENLQHPARLAEAS